MKRGDGYRDEAPTRPFDRLVRQGAELYERRFHLRRILAIGPDEVADESLAGRQSIVRKLARALSAERRRGRSGHWTYDLNRHIALAQAYTAERRLLAAAERLPMKSRRLPD